MIKNFLIAVAILFSIAALTGPAHGKEVSRSYDSLLISEIEQMPFSTWWQYLKRIAKEEGVYIEESDREYFRAYYYDDGDSPEEAFDYEYE